MIRQSFLSLMLVAALFAACNQAENNSNNAVVETTEEAFPGEFRLDSLTKLLEKDPDNTNLLNERAKVFLDVDQVNLAVADVGRAILLDSSVAEYYLTISDAYFRLNKPKKCKNALLKAVALQPDFKEPLYRLAQFELYLGNHQESINYANKMLRIDAQDDRPFTIKGLTYKDAGDTTKAIENYLEAVTQNPDNYDAYLQLGLMHFGRQEEICESYFKSALDIKPEGIDALYSLGLYYQNVDKLNEALETYAKILSIDSTYSAAYYNMGYIHYKYLNENKLALKNFDNAVKVNPKYYQAVYMRGLCYEAMGDVAKANREYSYALELKSDYKLAADGLQRLNAKSL